MEVSGKDSVASSLFSSLEVLMLVVADIGINHSQDLAGLSGRLFHDLVEDRVLLCLIEEFTIVLPIVKVVYSGGILELPVLQPECTEMDAMIWSEENTCRVPEWDPSDGMFLWQTEVRWQVFNRILRKITECLCKHCIEDLLVVPLDRFPKSNAVSFNYRVHGLEICGGFDEM